VTSLRKQITPKELIITGWRSYDSQEDWSHTTEVINDFFRAITDNDLTNALERCEFGEQEDLEYSGKLLLAYFSWCDRYEIETLPNEGSVEFFKIKFFQIICSQSCNYDKNSTNLPLSDLPEWRLPRIFERFPSRRGAKSKDTSQRSIDIYTLYLLEIKGQKNPRTRTVCEILEGRIDIKGIGYKTIERAIKEVKNDPAYFYIHHGCLHIICDQNHDELVNFYKQKGTLKPFRADP